jgi:hypothetical protein
MLELCHNVRVSRKLTAERQNADRGKSIGSRASLFQLVQIASPVLPRVI